ncbi:MAG: RNA methyltransferase [Muribaculaceae bacterium]|nr:RNA methyltransferase [Muribaculaceae bacterium]
MPEITNSIRKLVRSLATAKARRAEGAFVVEGTKSVLDSMPRFTLRGLFATSAWLESHKVGSDKVFKVSHADLERMSSLSTPPEVMAVFEIPDQSELSLSPDSLYLALDGVQDPGNLGTIIRLADWFGVTDIIASRDTVDVYNPKTIMATMGSVGRVNVHYTDLPVILGEALRAGLTVYGTFLDGENIFDAEVAPAGIVVMGNEGKGVSAEVAALVSKRLLIPAYPPGRSGAESLNVAMATAITLAELRRPLLISR